MHVWRDTVVGNRTIDRDGYLANIIGFLKPKKLNKPQLETIIDTFFQSIEDALIQKRSVELRGFGTFFIREIKDAPCRTVRNLRCSVLSSQNLSEPLRGLLSTAVAVWGVGHELFVNCVRWGCDPRAFPASRASRAVAHEQRHEHFILHFILHFRLYFILYLIRHYKRYFLHYFKVDVVLGVIV